LSVSLCVSCAAQWEVSGSDAVLLWKKLWIIVTLIWLMNLISRRLWLWQQEIRDMIYCIYRSSWNIVLKKRPVECSGTNRIDMQQNDHIQPKPSPTVMLYSFCIHTQEQLSFRYIKQHCFFKFYKHQNIKKTTVILKCQKKTMESKCFGLIN
jgi:hypothetical protein